MEQAATEIVGGKLTNRFDSSSPQKRRCRHFSRKTRSKNEAQTQKGFIKRAGKSKRREYNQSKMEERGGNSLAKTWDGQSTHGSEFAGTLRGEGQKGLHAK